MIARRRQRLKVSETFLCLDRMLPSLLHVRHVTAISYLECGFSLFFSFPSEHTGMFKLDNIRFLQHHLIFNINFNLRTKRAKRYVWSITEYGAATWTIRKVDQKCLGMFWNVVLEKDGEDHLYRSCEKCHVTKSQGGEEYSTKIKSRKDNWIGHILRRTAF